jgi:bacteriorhodopsin
MTWEEAASKKNRHTWIWLAVGTAIVGAATWCLMALVVFAHLKLSIEDARLVMTVALTLVWGAYFFGWTVRGNLVETIDTQMSTAGPFERERFAARVVEELKAPKHKSPAELYRDLQAHQA